MIRTISSTALSPASLATRALRSSSSPPEAASPSFSPSPPASSIPRLARSASASATAAALVSRNSSGSACAGMINVLHRSSASRHALEAEAINVGLIGRMLERGTETTDGTPVQQVLPGTIVTPRFARDDSHFAVRTTDDNEEVAG